MTSAQTNSAKTAAYTTSYVQTQAVPTSTILQEAQQVINTPVLQLNDRSQTFAAGQQLVITSMPSSSQGTTSATVTALPEQASAVINGQQIPVVMQQGGTGGMPLLIQLADGTNQTINLPLNVIQTLIQQQQPSTSGFQSRPIAPEPSRSPEEPPMYVNAKQYARIVKRREWRARMETLGRLPKGRSKYLHESRHKHAIQRQRNKATGRFAPGKKNEKEAEYAEAHNEDTGESSKGEDEIHQHSESAADDDTVAL